MNTLFKTKCFKIVLWLSSFLLLLAAALWTLSRHFEPKLKKEIKEVVYNTSKGLYSLEFDQINTNILLGNAVIKDVRLIPNWKIYDSLSKNEKAPDNLYEISLKDLKIRGFNPYLLFKKKMLSINSIRFERPKITMYHHTFSYNINRKLAPKENPYSYISKFLSCISVDAVNLEDIQFKYIDRDSSQKNKEIQNLQVQLLDWELNQNSSLDSSRFYYFKDAIFMLPEYNFTTKNGLYAGSWKNISLLFREKKINIQSFNIHPTLDINEFQQKLGYKKTSVETTLRDIHMENVDMLAFLRNGDLLVQRLNVNSGNLFLKNGKDIVTNTEEKIKVIPHELLEKIPLPLKIDSVYLNDIDVNYQEYSKKSNKSGTVSFDEAYFVMKNVTNMPRFFTRNSKMQVNASSKLMNKAPFSFNLTMFYGTPLGDFNINGKVGALNGRIFNQITVPLGLITIKSLNVQSLNFSLSGNNQNLKGNMKFIYKDFSVSIMHKNEENGKLTRKRLLSIFTNNWVIEPQNPRSNGIIVQAPIAINRNLNYSFAKYIWIGLKEGIKYSVGITPEKESSIQKKINQFNSLKENFEAYKEQIKKQRAENKSRRLLRRAERAKNASN